MTGCPRYIRGPSLWGSLHESLLERIFAKLPMLDLPQAREVCRQWVLPAGWCMKALKPLAWSHDLIHKFPNIERLDLSTATLCPGDLEMIAESFSRLGTLVLNKSKLVPIREEEKLGEGLTVMGTPAARESDGWGLHDLGAITSVDMSGCPRFDTRIFSVPQILATVRCLSLYGLDWIEDREFQNILRCCQYTLSSLDISWCKGLRRASIECLTGCPRLRDLSAEGCMRFGIEGFAQMSDLTSLRALNVAASPADDFTQEPLSGYNAHGLLLLSRMDHLTSLDVSNWPINNDELATVGTLTELRRLALNHCHLVSNTGLRHLTHVTALESLEVHGCNIMTPSLSTARFDFKRLRSISVLSGGVPHNMTNSPALLVEVVEKVGRELTSIEHIDLSYTCHCMDPCFPGVLDALYAVTTITSLDFTGSQGLMDHGLLALPRMMGLKKLRLARVSELTDATLFIVSRVTNLTFLDLSMGLYTDAGIVALKALVVLEELDLRSCPVAEKLHWRSDECSPCAPQDRSFQTVWAAREEARRLDAATGVGPVTADQGKLYFTALLMHLVLCCSAGSRSAASLQDMRSSCCFNTGPSVVVVKMEVGKLYTTTVLGLVVLRTCRSSGCVLLVCRSPRLDRKACHFRAWPGGTGCST